MALWTPSAISTALWLDASDSSTLFDAVSGGSTPANNGAIARWEDKSGNTRHVTQSTSGAEPTRQTSIQNALDIIRFDGSNDRLTRSALFTDNFSVYMVGRKRDLAVTRIAWLSQNNNTFDPQRLLLFTERTSGSVIGGLQVGSAGLVTGTPTGAFGIWGYTRSGTSGVVYRSAVGSSVTVSSGNVQSTDLAIGCGANDAATTDYSDIDIGEIVVRSGVDSTADRQLFEGYLAWKWGIQSLLPSDHPYKSGAPTTGAQRRVINDGLFNRGLFGRSLVR